MVADKKPEEVKAAAPDDGTVNMEAYMMGAMNKVLTPFVEHVWHLDTLLKDTITELNNTKAKLSAEGIRLDDTQANLAQTKADLAATDTRLEDTKKALAETNARLAILEKDHEAEKQHLFRVEKSLNATTADTNFLSSRLPKLTDDHVGRLQALLEEVQMKIEHYINPTLNKSVSDIADLNKQATTMSQGLATSLATGKNLSEALDRHGKNWEKQNLENAKHFNAIDEAHASFNERQKAFHTSLGQQGERLQHLDGEARSLRTATDSHAQKLTHLTHKHGQFESDHLNHLNRFESVELEWWEFRKTLGRSDDPNAGKRNIYEIVAELTEIVMKNKDDIFGLMKRKMHDEWIAKADKCMSDLKFKDEEKTKSLAQANTDLTDLINKVKRMDDDLGVTKLNLDQTKSNLATTGQKLQDTREDLTILNTKHDNTVDIVTLHSNDILAIKNNMLGMIKGAEKSTPSRSNVQSSDKEGVGIGGVKPVRLPMLTTVVTK